MNQTPNIFHLFMLKVSLMKQGYNNCTLNGSEHSNLHRDNLNIRLQLL